MYKITLLIFFFSLSLVCFSQETNVEKRPKVGLVMSGGGAKGFAHIGVLKVIEDAGVKIDYIGGTSMGAVVGGLYASGYNARQIDSIFSATNFDELIQDYIPRSSKSFYEKRNDETYAFNLPFSKFKLGVPQSFSKGMYNYSLLTKLTHKVRFITDFKKLPIPFICIATDIENGDQVVLRNGYLPQALLASSAFPSLFSPVEIDGRLLVDGGVSNNYPIEEVRKMGADIVIGVDIQDDLKDRTQLVDATKILIQISNFEMIKLMQAKIDDTDIYIKPDITSFSVLSFSEGSNIVKKGEEAAFSVYEKLKKLSDNSGDVQSRGLRIENDTLHVKKLTISECKNYTRGYIIGKLKFKEGEKITYNDLKEGINNLNATQNFSSINYTITKFYNADELVIDLKENEIGSYFKFGLHYDGLYKSGVLANFTRKKALVKNDVLSLDLGLGDNFRYNFDYFIDNGFSWSFGFKSRLNQFSRNISVDFKEGRLVSLFGENSINLDFFDVTNQVYLQTVFMHKFQIGSGVELKYLKLQSKTLLDGNPVFDNSNYASVFGNMVFDSYDSKYYPKKGWFFSGNIKYLFHSSDYSNQFSRFSIATAEIGVTRTLAKNITLKFHSDGGFVIGSNEIPFFDFTFGGFGFNQVNSFRPFYGYDFLSLSADSYVKSLFVLDWEFYRKNHLNLSANYANIENDIFKSGNWFETPKFSGYALGYGLETILGPIDVKYSWSPEIKNSYLWLSVGYAF